MHDTAQSGNSAEDSHLFGRTAVNNLEGYEAGATSARACESFLFFHRNYGGSPVRKKQEGYGEGKDGISDL